MSEPPQIADWQPRLGHTSEPVPALHMIGNRPAIMATTVIIFGRTRSTASKVDETDRDGDRQIKTKPP
jgi:hypothetical protein